jgi:DNA-binding HxlR family transcriptional regulator
MDDHKKDKEINLYKENYLLNSVFIKDTDFQYIFKKTEKIVTAIYLVTNFLSAKEPLKWSLRNSSTSLLKSAMTFSRMSLSDREVRVHELNCAILEVSSLFDLSFRSGFISVMNYEIINFEISKLAASVANYQSGSISSGKGLFDDDYFHVHKNPEFDLYEKSSTHSTQKDNLSGNKNFKDNNIKDKYKGHDFYKRQNKNVFNEPIKNNRETSFPAYETSAQNSESNHKTATEHSNRTQAQRRNKKTNSERRDLIIAEIKKQGDVSVKDIAKILPTVSEKTLQRELIGMVDDGLLNKKGERRWSRYSLTF